MAVLFQDLWTTCCGLWIQWNVIVGVKDLFSFFFFDLVSQYLSFLFFYKGGTSKFAWEWTPGYWRGGVPRTFEWKQASPEPLYQLQTRLSFLDFNDWVKGK